MSGRRSNPCLAFFAFAALTGQASCRSSEQSPETAYFPLRADHEWVYEISRRHNADHARLSIRARGDQFVPPLAKRAHVVEERYATNLSAPPGEPVVLAYYQEEGFVHRAMSLEYRGREIVQLGPNAAETRFLPLRLDERSRWSGTTTAYDMPDGSGYSVEQTHAAEMEPAVVEVPAGRYGGCIRVDTVAVQQIREEGRRRGHRITFYYRDWYAPNVGLVRSHLSDRPDHRTVLAETRLVSFEPGRMSD